MKTYLLVAILVVGSQARVYQDMYESDDTMEQDLMEYGVGNMIHDDSDVMHNTRKMDVAFTVYYNGTLTSSGENQHVKFNKILLNDGEAYKGDIGVFRAPVCGVYSFSFSVAAIKQKTAVAMLKITGDKTIDGAVAISGHYYSTFVQGSQTALVHLHQGQHAWIELKKGSTLITQSDYPALTTFSGYKRIEWGVAPMQVDLYGDCSEHV